MLCVRPADQVLLVPCTLENGSCGEKDRNMYRTRQDQDQDLNGDGSPLHRLRLRRGYVVFHVDMIQLRSPTHPVVNPSHVYYVPYHPKTLANTYSALAFVFPQRPSLH
jgi:hypothetical protein